MMADESKFNTVAAEYAAGRPDYPAALFEAIAGELGRPLAGAHVLDLGAGTGIASRQLAERGAVVTAVELSRPMLGQIAASPGLRPVQASANALPFGAAVADVVTCAQAWHWMDPGRAVPEVRRVLREGGLFAAWWNHIRRDAEWEDEQRARIDAANPSAASQHFHGPGARDFDTAFGLDTARHDFRWERVVPLDVHLDNIGSKSFIAELGDPPAFLAREREILLGLFPGGFVTERFDTVLHVAREPR
jgi:SAM-dependent methyltransferase